MLANGIFVICASRPLQTDVLRGRIASLLDNDECVDAVVSQDARCMLGAVTGTHYGTDPKPWLTIERSDNGNRLGVFEGWTFVPSILPGHPARLGDQDLDFRTHCNGMFSAASWRDGTLTLTSDPLASNPLYVWSDRHLCVAAASMEVLLTLIPHEPRLNRGALAEFLAAQTLFGDESLIEGVRKLPGATLLRRQADTGTEKMTRYWMPRFGMHEDDLGDANAKRGGGRTSNIRQAGRHSTAKEASAEGALERAADTFAEAVRRTVKQAGDNPHVALTGGIDSRTIWAVILHDRTSATAVTHAAADGYDLKIARRIAADHGLPHRIARIGEEFLAGAEEDLRRLVEAGNSQCCGDLLHLPHLYRVHAGYTRSIIDGVNTYMERGFALRRAAGGARNRDQLADHLWEQLRRDGLLALMPEHERHGVEALAKQRLSDLLPDPVEFSAPGTAADMLYLQRLLTHHATDAAAVQNHRVRFLTPYYDLDYLDALLRMPGSQRSAEWLQREILRRYAPRLQRYPRSYADVRTIPVKWRPLALLPAVWERKVLPHLPGKLHRRLSLRRSSALHAEWFSGPLHSLFSDAQPPPEPLSANATATFLARLRHGGVMDTATAGWLLVLAHPSGLLRRFG